MAPFFLQSISSGENYNSFNLDKIIPDKTISLTTLSYLTVCWEMVKNGWLYTLSIIDNRNIASM